MAAGGLLVAMVAAAVVRSPETKTADFSYRSELWTAYFAIEPPQKQFLRHLKTNSMNQITNAPFICMNRSLSDYIFMIAIV